MDAHRLAARVIATMPLPTPPERRRRARARRLSRRAAAELALLGGGRPA